MAEHGMGSTSEDRSPLPPAEASGRTPSDIFTRLRNSGVGTWRTSPGRGNIGTSGTGGSFVSEDTPPLPPWRRSPSVSRRSPGNTNSGSQVGLGSSVAMGGSQPAPSTGPPDGPSAVATLDESAHSRRASDLAFAGIRHVTSGSFFNSARPGGSGPTTGDGHRRGSPNAMRGAGGSLTSPNSGGAAVAAPAIHLSPWQAVVGLPASDGLSPSASGMEAPNDSVLESSRALPAGVSSQQHTPPLPSASAIYSTHSAAPSASGDFGAGAKSAKGVRHLTFAAFDTASARTDGGQSDISGRSGGGSSVGGVSPGGAVTFSASATPFAPQPTHVGGLTPGRRNFSARSPGGGRSVSPRGAASSSTATASISVSPSASGAFALPPQSGRRQSARRKSNFFGGDALGGVGPGAASMRQRHKSVVAVKAGGLSGGGGNAAGATTYDDSDDADAEALRSFDFSFLKNLNTAAAAPVDSSALHANAAASGTTAAAAAAAAKSKQADETTADRRRRRGSRRTSDGGNTTGGTTDQYDTASHEVESDASRGDDDDGRALLGGDRGGSGRGRSGRDRSGSGAAVNAKTARSRGRPLPLQYLDRRLGERIAASGYYSDLFFFIPFIALFTLFYLYGRDIEVNHMTAAAVRLSYLDESLPGYDADVAAIDAQAGTNDPRLSRTWKYSEIYDASTWRKWVSGVLVPQTWDCTAPGYSRSMIARHGQTQYLGAIQLRVQRMRRDSCAVPPGYAAALRLRDLPKAPANATTTSSTNNSSGCDNNSSSYTVVWGNNSSLCNASPILPTTSSPSDSGFDCFGVFDKKGLDTDDDPTQCNASNPALPSEMLWRYEPADPLFGVATTGKVNRYPSGGYTATLPFAATCDQVRSFVELISEMTVDPVSGRSVPGPCNIIDTRSTRFVTTEWFSYASNTDTFLTSKLFFDVLPGGIWLPNSQMRMFPVWTSARLGQSALDIVFFLITIFFLYRFTFDWISWRRANPGRTFGFLLSLWNLLDLVNYCTLVAVVALRFTWWIVSARSSDAVTFPFASEYPKELDFIAVLYSYQVYANSINVVLIYLKVLKYFELNNRLNILTRTFAVCQQSILGVLVLFLFVILGYAGAATQLYGDNIYGFRDIDSSFSSMMFMLLGQFDYESMRALQPLLTGPFFFSFMVLSNFLLLNFIIAILNDGFSTVSTTTPLEPLGTSIMRVLKSTMRNLSYAQIRRRISLHQKGQSIGSLTHELRLYIRVHLESIAAENLAALDDDIMTYMDDLRHFCPEELLEALGTSQVAWLWEDLVADYDLAEAVENAQVHNNIENAIIHAFRVTYRVNERLMTLNRTSNAIQRLEDLVKRVGAQQAAAVAAKSQQRRRTLHDNGSAPPTPNGTWRGFGGGGGGGGTSGGEGDSTTARGFAGGRLGSLRRIPTGKRRQSVYDSLPKPPLDL